MPIEPRRAPWEPGLLSVEPRGFAARLADMGKGRDEILSALRERFPGSTPQNLGQIATAAGRIRSVLNTFDPDFVSSFRRVDLPRNAGLPNNYRFIATVGFQAPGGRETTYRTVVIDSDANLSMAAIAAQATQAAEQILFGPRYRVSDELFDLIEISGIDIVLAERRT